MVDKPIRTNVLRGKTHVCFILPSDRQQPPDHYVYPCFAVANESGYFKNYKIMWRRDRAEEFTYLYNTQVLKLTPGQAEAILVSSMRHPHCPYPAHYESNKALFEEIGSRQQELLDLSGLETN